MFSQQSQKMMEQKSVRSLQQSQNNMGAPSQMNSYGASGASSNAQGAAKKKKKYRGYGAATGGSGAAAGNGYPQQSFQQKTGQTSESVVKAYGFPQRMPNGGNGLDTSSKIGNSELKGDSKLVPTAPTFGNYGAVRNHDAII